MTYLNQPALIDVQGFAHGPTCRATDGSKLHTRQGHLEQVTTCRACGRTLPAASPFAKPAPRPRYWLGCRRCGADMYPSSNRPRLPFCDTCKDQP